MPIKGDSFMTIALERPGASADGGVFEDRIEIQNLRGRFPYPDLSAEYRHAADWGYIEAAGILRYMEWDDTLDDQFDLSGSTTGWGINITSNIKTGNSVIRLAGVYGEGVENYMNDAPVDVGAELNPGNTRTPIDGKALPLLGLVAFIDHNWSAKASTAFGWSMLDIDNSNGQADNAFSEGHYALVNYMYYPTKGVMLGPEIQWGNRKNFRDGFTVDDLRIQFSAKYNFGHKIGG
jgi:hypothetical protein